MKQSAYYVALMLSVATTAARADDEASPQSEASTHIHRQADEAAASPITLDIVYTGEVGGVASGGLRRDVRYLDNLDIV
ncbi:MAG: hypothetical protein ACRCY3_15500, partial [Sphingorhabdus sp.]